MRSIVTVTVPAASNDLTTIDMVYSELGIAPDSPPDVDLEAKLYAYIRQASNTIASYCNRVFGLETVEERFLSVRALSALSLRRRPIATLTSVTEAGSVLGATEYYLDAEAGLLYKANFAEISPAWSGEVVVVYQSGYALLDGLPHAIERACLMLVKQYHFSQARDPYLRSEDIPGVASYGYGFGPQVGGERLPPEVAVLLSPFKELCVA